LTDTGFVVTAVRPVVAEVTTSLTKTAALAPNRIDVIVACRKAKTHQVPATPAQARARVMTALLRLQDSGLTVGEGDALSATRASVLALGTHDPDCDWQELRHAAETQAAYAVKELAAVGELP
jgi:putative DNA methylase